MPDADFRLLQPHLEPVKLERRKIAEKPNVRIEHVYFVSAGIISVVIGVDHNTEVEVGLIGCEGMSGVSIIHGDDRGPHSTYVQVDGHGQRIAVKALTAAMQKSEFMRALFLKYAQAFMIQTNHTAVSNARGKLDERLARWILMAHDRLPGNDIRLTHEFLAVMLGVRRAGVTEAVHVLATRGLIRNDKPGLIELLDRAGLEKTAGSFYGGPEREYKRLIG